MRRRIRSVILGSLLTLPLAAPAPAGVVVYEEGDKKIEVGGRIQIEYVSTSPDCPAGTGCFVDAGLGSADSTVDELKFRRLRPYVAGSVTKNWFGKIEFDFGESSDGDELQIKDAYMTWSGLGKGLELSFGNAKGFFSREFITSSAKLQMVERSFVGDHNFGSPDRVLGLKLAGKSGSKKLGYGVSLGVGAHDPSSNRMDFDTPVNAQGDWNEGPLLTARVDFHPFGEVKFQQADFERGEFRMVASLGTFLWKNDDDNNPYTGPGGTTIPQAGSVVRADLDEATGWEASVGLRCHGFSGDFAYHRVGGDTVDPAFTGGLYVGGTTDMDLMAVTAGYLLPGDRVEVTAAWDAVDADGYAEEFRRTTVGLNWYLNRHDLKLQANYSMWRNLVGIPDHDPDVLLVMMQYVF